MSDLYTILRRIQKMCTNSKHCMYFLGEKKITCPLYDHNDGYCIFTDCPEHWTLKENEDQIKAYEGSEKK